MGQSNQKIRLDSLLVEKNIAESKAKSQAMIMAGTVLVDGEKIEKAGTRIRQDAEISLIKAPPPYVSRGGLKLEGALTAFDVDVKGLTALDVGASTGGFTDCLLKFGAGHVFALDVGYGQIDWKLRNDPRVTVFERTNIRHVKKSDFTDFNIDGKTDIEIAVIDVSFISLKLVLPAVRDIIAKDGHVIALIKPQFEVGKGEVGKGGVVRDEEKHREVVERIKDFAVNNGFASLGTAPSQILGPKGNREFFIYLKRSDDFRDGKN